MADTSTFNKIIIPAGIIIISMLLAFSFNNVSQDGEDQEKVFCFSGSIVDYKSYKDYSVKVAFCNQLATKIFVPWGPQAFLNEYDERPVYNIYFISSKGEKNEATILKSNPNGTLFEDVVQFYPIEKDSVLVKTINIKHLFGDLIPEHDMILVELKFNPPYKKENFSSKTLQYSHKGNPENNPTMTTELKFNSDTLIGEYITQLVHLPIEKKR